MSEVSPLDEQFEPTHTIVRGRQYLTFFMLYIRDMFSSRSRV